MAEATQIMTPARLAEIEARLEAATPGRPWSCNTKTGTIYAPDVTGVVEIGEIGAFLDRALLPFNKDRWLGDLALLTAAPTDIADLLAEVERLQAVIKDYDRDIAQTIAQREEERKWQSGLL